MMAMSMLRKVIWVMKVVAMKMSQMIVSFPSILKFSTSNSPIPSKYWLKIASINWYPKTSVMI